MPELPEVEMVARHLQALLPGQIILKARLLRPRLAPENTPRQFSSWLRQTRVQEIGRRGKHLLFHFENARTLIVHLRMTGRFLYLDQDRENPVHTHALFWLENGKKLAFSDQRHFGMMHLLPTAAVLTSKYLSRLAPEPLSKAFTSDYLFATLQRSKQPLKLTLLDQTKVLGLGNIYASEALHRARINPQLPALELSQSRTAHLHQEIIAVLRDAIANNSTLNTNPEDLDGSYGGGGYESMTQAYEREGLPCYTCRAPIQRITQGGRSTYFCPRCQKN